MQHLNELEWIELASRKFWARVYSLKALTNCTLEDAIKAVQATDQENRARTV